jgi:hypothetical protein
MVVGDWGAPPGGVCAYAQRQVAELMRAYASGHPGELIAVLSVGDAFYWTGLGDLKRFRSTWRDIYQDLTAVPWFNVMGNHDWGNDDNLAACQSSRLLDASRHPRETQAERAQYNNFVQPDYSYYYTLGDLLEIVAVDTNGEHLNALGGDGLARGARRLAEACGGQEALRRRMLAIRDAGLALLKARGIASRARNVALLSHYPEDDLLSHWPKANALHFFGHVHDQGCRDGGCRRVLTGGGGGCCPPRCTDGHRGFTVVRFRCDGLTWTQYVDCIFPNPRCSVP